MSKRLIFLLVGLCTIFSLPAFAVDGVVLINQATVNAAGGFPYKITQPGSYKLSGNLVVTVAADAIDINSDDVTLDLNGFTITCNDPGENSCASASFNDYSGVQSGTGHKDLTVMNGSIRGFAHGGGVTLSGLSSGVLSDLKVTGNFFGIAVTGFTVFRCAAISNFGYGIAAQNSTVTSSVAHDNSVAGFAGGGSVIINNVANSNGIGLQISNDLYGGNNVQNNGTSIQNFGGSVSQNNNNCNGVVC